jgi:hypothetical protein
MVPYPKDALLEMGLPEPFLPHGDEVPLDVEVVYTAYLPGKISLYDTIALSSEDGSDSAKVIAIGAVADNPNLLYVLSPETGEILQLDLDEQNMQNVNSNYRCFVEFLYHFAKFVQADEGQPGRAARAEELRRTLYGIDSVAFAEDAWWVMVFERLMS